ncbi:MAG: glycerol kinase GlpK, partial [Erysipelotrichaceae bacterium]
RWILDQYPNVNVEDLLFGTIDTWLLWKLTAGQRHATDVSNASRTMLYNIHEMKWDDELLSMLKIPRNILPEVCDTSCLFATTSKNLFFNQEIPITSLVGDQQAALFGQCCFEKGMVKNTYGTGGFLLMNTDDQIIDSKYGLVSTVAWRINGKVQYALEGSIFISGSLIKWLRDGLNIIEDAKQTEAMAKSVDNANGVYIVPAFVGLGTPYWDDQCLASILGLTQGVNKNHIARAALEAMCYQSKDVLDAMIKDAEVDVELLRVDGGASKNKFLLQFQSDLLNIPVENLISQETTALGAAYLAGLAVGFYKKEELSAKREDQFLPTTKQSEMKRLYQGWQRAVVSTRSFKGV